MKILLTFTLLCLLSFGTTAQAGGTPQWQRDIEKLAPSIIKKYRPIITYAAWEFNVSPRLIMAILITESMGNPKAVSKAGAKGLMQTKSIIDKETGIHGKPFDPLTSVRRGAKFLAMLRDRYGLDSLEEMSVGYYTGPTRARRMSPHKIVSHFYYKRVLFVLENVPKELFLPPTLPKSGADIKGMKKP